MLWNSLHFEKWARNRSHRREGKNKFVIFLLRVLCLPTSLLPYISFRNITFVLLISSTQKWRNIFWFSCTYYSSLPESLLHYGIIKNLASPFQDICQVSAATLATGIGRLLVKCSSKPRMAQKLCHQCSQSLFHQTDLQKVWNGFR